MSIDYRKEVDSGFDRKRIVETCVIKLLKDNIPVDIITSSPEFNFRHLEMIRNLRKGNESKEEQILDTYGGYGKELSEPIVPDRYSGVEHPIEGELYPMEKEEEQQKFKQRDEYIEQIEKLKKREIKKIGKERDKILSAITKYKVKFPVIDRIISAIEEIDEKKESGVVLNVEEIFKKNELNLKELKKYERIYNSYKELTESLNKLTVKYEAALVGRIESQEIQDLVDKKNLLETELIQRNVKLVNGFIRQKYKSLIVETEELFQICYIAMWKAVKDFDYKKEKKFSTLAYTYMDQAVKHDFKTLTGEKWDKYWGRRKIESLLKTTSEMLGRTVDVKELIQYGFLSMSEEAVKDYMNVEFSFSDLFPVQDYEEYEVDSQYATYFGDDEIDDYENGVVDRLQINCDGELFKSMLREEIDNVLNTLTDREKLVLKLRFGLEDGVARTLEEVGALFNVTRERVRQIEAKALRKLRHPSRSSKLKGFIDDATLTPGGETIPFYRGNNGSDKKVK